MNADQVKKQIENMQAFILKEAKEKKMEILDKAAEEFTMEKARIVQAEKQKIKKEYERKEKKLESDKKIAYSNQLNQSRLKVLKAREDIVNDLKSRAQEQLAQLGKPGPEYESLLQQLILQALIKLEETNVSLRCRKEDEAAVKRVLPAAIEGYKKKTTKTATVTIDTAHYLPSAPGKSDTPLSCCGGVVLSAQEGKIMCDNTLDQRLALAFDANIPKIRQLLFS
jgi:V-type H+-transporting ATPase subunit E